MQDINHRLQARGHTTRVLTSTHGIDTPTHEADVGRLLTLESNIYNYQPRQFLGHKRRLKQNLEHTRQTIERFRPDVIFIHVMWNLSRGIAWLAEQLCPGRVVYYVANDWPHAIDPHTAYWCDQAERPLLNIAKSVIAPIPLKIVAEENRTFNLKFDHVLCVSQAVKNDLGRNAGIAPENMSVVYNGVETDLFVPPEPTPNGQTEPGALSLVYAGSLVTHKGVHTAIQAMAILAKNPELDGVTLTIIGGGHPDYEAYLKKLVIEANLTQRVKFVGRVPREEMPALLQKFDVLIFPSIWEEPLARMTQEAMAAGLVVIGTLTGGTGELLVENETGLTFEPEDPNKLAQQIERLSLDPALQSTLRKNGRDTVIARFDLCRMIDEIETYLTRVIENHQNTVASR
ncbi:MAG: glycosyltransferase family 4 protein [Anaerolineales bacterium]|nr:glycosyltransferase family 4 protein [Anaerolineales bacterium]